MTVTTYSGLKASIAKLLNRTDLDVANAIPDWITMAEAVFNRRLVSKNMVVTETITITGGTYPIPDGFSAVQSFWLDVNQGQPLEYLTPDQFDNVTSASNQPMYYTIAGGYFYIAPSSPGPYTARLRYSKNITPLSDTNPTNWISLNHPDLYLYGAAVHSAPFLNDDVRITLWQGKHDALVDEVNKYSRREMQGSRMQTMSGLTDRGFITSGMGAWR